MPTVKSAPRKTSLYEMSRNLETPINGPKRPNIYIYAKRATRKLKADRWQAG